MNKGGYHKPASVLILSTLCAPPPRYAEVLTLSTSEVWPYLTIRSFWMRLVKMKRPQLRELKPGQSLEPCSLQARERGDLKKEERSILSPRPQQLYEGVWPYLSLGFLAATILREQTSLLQMVAWGEIGPRKVTK